MLKKITGYTKDSVDDWVAILCCGHNQHVRHNPPWTNRAWVETEAGRREKIGHSLDCKKCERGEPRDIQ